MKKEQTADKHRVYNLVILDESGSMESIREFIISGFNELVGNIKGVAEQFPDQEHLVSLVTFNSLGIKEQFYNQTLDHIQPMNEEMYHPDAMTPLHDAIGINTLKLKYDIENTSDHHVLVTILTDGLENHSKEFHGRQIKRLIDELSTKNWTFTYIGTDHDIKAESDKIGITAGNTLEFRKSRAGVREVFAKERTARMNFNTKIKLKEDTSSNYYIE